MLALHKSYWAMRKQDEVRIFLQVLRSLSAQKRKHYFEQSNPLLTSGLWLLKQFLVTRVHLALIFSLFPVNFELSIHSYRLTGSDVLAQTKVSNVACFWPANRDVCFLFFGALWEFCILSGAILVVALKEFAYAFSCAYIELWMHFGSLESTQKARVALGCASSYSYAFFVLSKLPSCIHNSIYAGQTWTNS